MFNHHTDYLEKKLEIDQNIERPYFHEYLLAHLESLEAHKGEYDADTVEYNSRLGANWEAPNVPT